MVHQDAKIITKERPGDPECVGRGEDKELTEGKQDDREDGCVGFWEQWDARLVGQCALVAVVV